MSLSQKKFDTWKNIKICQKLPPKSKSILTSNDKKLIKDEINSTRFVIHKYTEDLYSDFDNGIMSEYTFNLLTEKEKNYYTYSIRQIEKLKTINTIDEAIKFCKDFNEKTKEIYEYINELMYEMKEKLNSDPEYSMSAEEEEDFGDFYDYSDSD